MHMTTTQPVERSVWGCKRVGQHWYGALSHARRAVHELPHSSLLPHLKRTLHLISGLQTVLMQPKREQESSINETCRPWLHELEQQAFSATLAFDLLHFTVGGVWEHPTPACSSFSMIYMLKHKIRQCTGTVQQQDSGLSSLPA